MLDNINELKEKAKAFFNANKPLVISVALNIVMFAALVAASNG